MNPDERPLRYCPRCEHWILSRTRWCYICRSHLTNRDIEDEPYQDVPPEVTELDAEEPFSLDDLEPMP